MNRVRDGDLYKKITVGEVEFEILYGYYEDFEKDSQFSDPIPIYPDFTVTPMFTIDGYPIVTAMQDKCDLYSGNDECDMCVDCEFFLNEEDLFGTCRNKNKRR